MATNHEHPLYWVWGNMHNRWTANIAINGKRIWLGSFELKQDAIDARLSAEAKYDFGRIAS